MTNIATGGFPPDDEREIRERNQREYRQNELCTSKETSKEKLDLTGMFDGFGSFVDSFIRFSKSPQGQAAISTGINFIQEARQDYRRKKYTRSVFLSYRQSDSLAFVTQLHESLEMYFGDHSTVFDNRNLPLGTDFRSFLLDGVRQSKVVLAVIGEDWHGYNDNLTPRIDDPNDFVRLEIEGALEYGKPIIPLLIGRGSNIGIDDLPPPIRDLAYLTALRILPDRPLASQLPSLFDAITRHVENKIV